MEFVQVQYFDTLRLNQVNQINIEVVSTLAPQFKKIRAHI